MFISNNSSLIDPYGGRLLDLTVPAEAYESLKTNASRLPSLQISPRSVCDLELLATGAFSPLDRFMGRADYQRVVEEMRLGRGQIFPVPITLPVEASRDIHLDRDIALRNNENELLGIMTIEDIYPWDRDEYAKRVLGTRDLHHPLADELYRWGDLNISGRLQIIHLPDHLDFKHLRLTPSQTRARLAAMGHQNVAAYQPRDLLPHIDRRFLEKALGDFDGTILLHLAVGLARLGDVDHYARVRIYNALVEQCAKSDQILFSLFPLSNRMAGLRETLLQVLMNRNYGANHMIMRRAQAYAYRILGNKTTYEQQGAQDLAMKYSQELGVQLLLEDQEPAQAPHSAAEHSAPESIVNPPVIDEHPKNGQDLSGVWRQDPVAEILAEIYPPRHQQGVCIWFTGLSGSGKSTTAEMLTWLLMEHGRRVTVLDGDVVRTHLSKGLGFSKEDRDTNVRRIGYVASELVRIGGVVICSVVSPYRAARNDVRNMMGAGQFIEVFVNTPLEVCETRDVKGMYARARRGELLGFTGIDDPYEPPDHPEITLDTVNHTPQDNAQWLIKYLIEQGFIRVRNQSSDLHKREI